MSVDHSLVDRIVQGVLQQLQRPAAPAAPALPVATHPKGTAVPQKPAGDHRVPQSVITARLIEELVPRDAVQVIVTSKAVITPAALDVLRARKLTVRRETPAAAPASSTTGRLLAIVVRNTPVLERLHKRRGSGWKRELLGCPDDAAKLAISAVCRGDADRVVIFATQHFRAACLANRHESIKAIAISSLDELQKARTQLRVNVVCIDPIGRQDFELTRLLEEWAKPAKG